MIGLDDLRGVLKRKREELGLSQFEVADRAGVTQAFIARIESGTAGDVSYSKIQAIFTSFAFENDGKVGELRLARHVAIKEALLGCGYTLRDLAHELEVHDSTVGSVVAGRSKSARVEARILELTGLKPFSKEEVSSHPAGVNL